MSFWLVPKWVTLNDVNGVMAVILGYFSEIDSFRGALRKSGLRYTQTFCNRNIAQSF